MKKDFFLLPALLFTLFLAFSFQGNAQNCSGVISPMQSYVCPGNTGTYSYSNPGPNNSFIWNAGNLGTIVSGQGTATVTIEWNYPFGYQPNPGDFDVMLDVLFNGGLCNILFYTESTGFAPSASGPVGSQVAQVGDTSWYYTRIFDGLSSAPYGSLLVTGGTVVQTGSVDMTGPGNFFWTGNYYAVVWDSAGPGSVAYTYCNVLNYGCCETSTLPVNVSANPSLHTVVEGPELICVYDTATYWTPNDPGYAYNWTVSGGNILSGQGTAAIEVAWNTNTQENAGGFVLVRKTGALSGTSALRVVHTDPYNLGFPTLQILYGPTNAAGCGPQKYYASMKMENYNWVVQGGNLISGQGTDTAMVQWSLFGTHNIEVTGSITNHPNCSFPGTTRSLNVSQSLQSLTYPQVLSSPTALLNSTVTYSTPLYAGHSYNWAITGGTIVSGQGTNQVTVQWTSGGMQSLTISETGPSCGLQIQNIPVNVTGFNVSISATDTTTYAYGGTANCTQLTANTSPVPSNPTYSWSTGDATQSISVCPTTTTTYSVTVSDASAGTQTSSFTVTVLPAPTCNGGTGVQICRSFGQFTFNQCVAPFSLQTYLAQGATLGPCPNKAGQPAPSEVGPSLQLQPNPWTEHCKLSVELPIAQNVEVSMTDVHGKAVRKIFSGKVEAGVAMKFSLQRNRLAAGLYFIQLQTEYQGTTTQKVILQ